MLAEFVPNEVLSDKFFATCPTNAPFDGVDVAGTRVKVDAAKWSGRNYRLYVFEFEGRNGDVEIVSVTHPDTGKKVRAVDEEWNVWKF